MITRAIIVVRELFQGLWQPVGMCCGLDITGLQVEEDLAGRPAGGNAAACAAGSGTRAATRPATPVVPQHPLFDC